MTTPTAAATDFRSRASHTARHLLLTRNRRLACAFAAYLLLTLAWFAPMAFQFRSTVLRSPADHTLTIRADWATEAQGKTPFTLHQDYLNGAPEGIPYLSAVTWFAPGQGGTTLALKYLVGWIGAYNLFILLGFLLTGFVMFALLDRLGFHPVTSFFGSYVVTFNPWMFERAFAGHAAFNHAWIFGVLILTMLRLSEHRTMGSAALVGAAFGASFWITSYYGLIAALVAVVYLLYELVRVGGLAERLWTITLSCVALGVTMLMLAPGLFVYFRDRARVSHTISQANAETQRLGTEAASYALPSVHHPLFGDLVRRYEPARDFAENTLFFGYTTIILALIGIVLVVRRHPLTTTTLMRSRALVFAAVLLPVAFWSSLRRVLHVAGLPIPTLSWFVTHITTYYRVYARFGIVVAIALVLLAAPALEHLVRRSRLGLVTAIAACFLVGFELLPGKVIAWQATDPPAYDVWLARQPEGIVVHYPLPTDKKAADRMSAREIYFQMFHGHPLFNVVGPGTKDTREDGIRVLSRYITDPSTPGILAAEGVKYILVHDRVYREQRETPPEVSGAFVPVTEFPGVRVFELSPDVAPVDLDGLLESRAAEIAAVQGRKIPAVEYAGGFSGLVPGPDTGEWRRLEDEGRIVLVHDDPTLKRVLLYLRLVSEDVPRTVRLFDSRGALVGEAIVQPQATDVTFGPIATHEGDTELVLTAEPGVAGDSGLLLAPVRVQPLADFSVSLRETAGS